MRVFVTGASGWIGSAVVPELLTAGHEVVGLARSDASAATLRTAGADVLRGDLDDLDTLAEAAASADGVVHLAFLHDFARMADATALDRRVVDTFGVALAGSGKPLVAASGTPIAPGRAATEDDAFATEGPLAGRNDNAKAVLALAQRGVRSSVVRMPRSVHGDGDRHGLVRQLIGIAREQGVAGYVGDGAQRWPAVHVSDAGALVRLALEQAPAGSVLHAVGDEGVPIRDIADVIGGHLDLPVEARPAEEFGFLGMLLAVDQPASSALTRDLLGWQPAGPGLIDDLVKGHYFA